MKTTMGLFNDYIEFKNKWKNNFECCDIVEYRIKLIELMKALTIVKEPSLFLDMLFDYNDWQLIASLTENKNLNQYELERIYQNNPNNWVILKHLSEHPNSNGNLLHLVATSKTTKYTDKNRLIKIIAHKNVLQKTIKLLSNLKQTNKK